MKIKFYCVFDSAVGSYLAPFTMRTNGEALRAWKDLVNDPSTNFAKHPSDYTLFELGSFDPDTAGFDLHPSPVSLGVGIEFVESRNTALHAVPQEIP